MVTSADQAINQCAASQINEQFIATDFCFAPYHISANSNLQTPRSMELNIYLSNCIIPLLTLESSLSRVNVAVD